ncbi:MAG: Asp-tRNA(Asn)/Glu-tRNA(Gln) amidotransferase subunit GatB [Anaerolineae bacterium]|jgi:aspartyl-tRNA(Asn)/glutamyl-tRNA(Gln) amidotransferase subunit B|nr:Asp-tRNA(Asn)/Glu-tRNA(Gln) amidotransferase subunit GatB [Chloroflexota bacterium]
MEYIATIGMEVHAEILTQTKMFCPCPNDLTAAGPNTHTCPVCLGMPGALPTINRTAVEATILTGMALNCSIAEFTKFDRKNYFYPDLAKGYQVSQYDLPLCSNGHLDVLVDGEPRRFGIRRVHLEEDTARLVHGNGVSLIDFNRSGVPLMEIVTEADLHSPEDAHAYLTKLRQILRYLGVSTGNMDEGAMRCEANISVSPKGSSVLGTRVEIKNINSFRSVRQAIAYEFERQVRVLEEGGRLQQVTMGWDENNLRTVFQRSKEGAEDYRYFPEPDLPPLTIDEHWFKSIQGRMPELPDARCARVTEQYGLRTADAELLTQDRLVADYYEDVVRVCDKKIAPQTVANWVLVELFRLLSETNTEIARCPVSPAALAELLGLLTAETINGTTAKEVLSEMFRSGKGAAEIVEARGLSQISDADALRTVVLQVLEQHSGPVQQYLAGKSQVMGFLVGQVMRQTRGKANVALVTDILRQALAERNQA